MKFEPIAAAICYDARMNPPAPDDRHYFKYDPRRPDPEMEPGESYGLSNNSDDKPNPLPEVKPDEDLLAPAPTGPTKKRKKRRLDADGKPIGEVDPKYHDKVLDRPDDVPPRPWWLAAAIVAGIGALFCLIPIVVVAMRTKQAAPTVAIYLVLAAIVAMLVETVLVTGLMYFVGQIFDIDYGPAKVAVVKFAATVTLLNGLVLLTLVFLSPLALMTPVLVTIIVFISFFRLNIQETIITIGVLVAVTGVLQVVIFAIILAKRIKGA